MGHASLETVWRPTANELSCSWLAVPQTELCSGIASIQLEPSSNGAIEPAPRLAAFRRGEKAKVAPFVRHVDRDLGIVHGLSGRIREWVIISENELGGNSNLAKPGLSARSLVVVGSALKPGQWSGDSVIKLDQRIAAGDGWILEIWEALGTFVHRALQSLDKVTPVPAICRLLEPGRACCQIDRCTDGDARSQRPGRPVTQFSREFQCLIATQGKADDVDRGLKAFGKESQHGGSIRARTRVAKPAGQVQAGTAATAIHANRNASVGDDCSGQAHEIRGLIAAAEPVEDQHHPGRI